MLNIQIHTGIESTVPNSQQHAFNLYLNNVGITYLYNTNKSTSGNVIDSCSGKTGSPSGIVGNLTFVPT